MTIYACRIDRRVTQDITIKGVHLPKDTMVVISMYAMHRLPEFFPDPEKFKPERYVCKFVHLLDVELQIEF